MNKKQEQMLEARRARRQAKANAAELELLKEKNPGNKAVNDLMRNAGCSISVELAHARKALNAVCEALGIEKPTELQEWNAVAEAAKAQANSGNGEAE